MNPTEEQEWRKRLRAHDRKLLATIVVMMGAYFAALIAVIQWALASSGALKAANTVQAFARPASSLLRSGADRR
jgi:hypothetical protein